MTRSVRLTGSAVALAATCALPCFFGAALVCGGSMEPALSPGDLVVYRRTSQVGPGDVVVFDRGGWPGGVVHRVTALLPDRAIRTRGDANPIDDLAPVEARRIKGRAVAVLPVGSALDRWGK